MNTFLDMCSRTRLRSGGTALSAAGVITLILSFMAEDPMHVQLVALPFILLGLALWVINGEVERRRRKQGQVALRASADGEPAR